MEWDRDDGYVVTDDPTRVDLDKVHHWLSVESYWATGRSVDTVAKSLRNSITLSCLSPAAVQVGIARWVTDGATFGWLSDVFIEAPSRGKGLGLFLLQCALDHPEVRGLHRLLLATSDAHELYRQVGFVALSEPGRWMELRSASSS